MTDTINQPIQHFLDTLASKTPTPGGGSVAALMGAHGAALVSMVCHLTLGKPQYASAEGTLNEVLAQAQHWQQQLTAMVKADIDVFDKLMACYGLPKDSEAEKAERSAAIQNVLKQATDVPLECAKACYQVINLSEIAAQHGYRGVISDAGVAVLSAHSGLKSAALNVYINTASLKDREFASAKLAELEALLAGVDAKVEAIYQMVKEKL